MLELAREVSIIHGLQDPLPAKRVWMADPDFDWYCKWLRSDTKKIQIKDTGGTKRDKGLLKLLAGPSNNRVGSEVLTRVKSNYGSDVARFQESDARLPTESQMIEYLLPENQGSLAQNEDEAGEARHPRGISGSMENSTVVEDRDAGQAVSDEDDGEFDLGD